MPIQIVPTLALMTRIYGLSAVGGGDSERFAAYLEATASDAPVYGYNPMTQEPVIDVVKALVALGVETVAEQVANETARKIGFDEAIVMHLTVATPGMWTDRLGTEIEHRLKAADPTGVLLWSDDPVSLDHVKEQVIAQTVRLKAFLDRQNRPPSTLAEAVNQEGTAAALSGQVGVYDQRTADVLSELSGDTSLATMVALLYGDDAASTMGYVPLGISGTVGFDHSVHLCS